MRVAILQHAPFEGPGRINQWLDLRAARVRVFNLYADVRLPKPDDFDLLIVLGGPMSVHDEGELPWLKAEKQLIRKSLDAGKSWQHVLQLDDDCGCVDVVMDPYEPKTLYAATFQVRRDGTAQGNPAVQFGAKSGIHKTDDAGQTWRRLTKGLPERSLGRIGIDVFRSNQIREGLVTRELALALAAEDNRPRIAELTEFARLIGISLEETLGRIDQIPPLGPRA